MLCIPILISLFRKKDIVRFFLLTSFRVPKYNTKLHIGFRSSHAILLIHTLEYSAASRIVDLSSQQIPNRIFFLLRFLLYHRQSLYQSPFRSFSDSKLTCSLYVLKRESNKDRATAVIPEIYNSIHFFVMFLLTML